MEKIKNGGLPEEGNISLYSLKAEYLQKSDSCGDAEGGDNTLIIEAQNGGYEADDTYLIIKTDRWAIDSPEELLQIVKDFNSRFYKTK